MKRFKRILKHVITTEYFIYEGEKYERIYEINGKHKFEPIWSELPDEPSYGMLTEEQLISRNEQLEKAYQIFIRQEKLKRITK